MADVPLVALTQRAWNNTRAHFELFAEDSSAWGEYGVRFDSNEQDAAQNLVSTVYGGLLNDFDKTTMFRDAASQAVQELCNNSQEGHLDYIDSGANELRRLFVELTDKTLEVYLTEQFNHGTSDFIANSKDTESTPVMRTMRTSWLT